MEVIDALAEFRQLQHMGKLTPGVVTRLVTEAASAFLGNYAAAGGYVTEAITLLAEVATLEAKPLSQIGVHGLFPLLVEPLADAFEPAACRMYNRLFAQVIEHCRHLPRGAALDALLRHFGLITHSDLLARAARLHTVKRFDGRLGPQIKKVFVLSRVTLGADIAVTSLALATMKRVFPDAELILVANWNTHQLFAGDPYIHLCPIEYARGSGLFDRLTSWQTVVEAIQQRTAGLQTNEYVIVDPDSRLTQLGLLPLALDERCYFFFESRSYAAPGRHKIGELTAHWLSQVFGTHALLYPYFAPSTDDVAFARGIVEALRATRRSRVVSINYGVGANPHKRLPDPFEFMLLERLLRNGATILLDKGGETEEAARVETLRAACQSQGFNTTALDTNSGAAALSRAANDSQLITWQGGIGRFGALIGESDVYIGYDSAGQHIAAALGIPTVDVFTGFSSPRMPERWAPYGPGPVSVVVVDAAETFPQAKLRAIVDAVLGCVARAGKRSGV